MTFFEGNLSKLSDHVHTFGDVFLRKASVEKCVKDTYGPEKKIFVMNFRIHALLAILPLQTTLLPEKLKHEGENPICSWDMHGVWHFRTTLIK